jgi:urease accessory protein
VKVCTSASVGSGGRLARLQCSPPLTVRQVHAEPGVCGLCLVGTAAGPLADDDLTLRLHLEPDAHARLTATGASIAQGRPGGAASNLTMSARLADGADLVADPGPLVVCAGSRVDVAVWMDLAPSARIEWREIIVLGRSIDATSGAATIRWDVTRGGRAVLHQFVDLTDPSLRHWATGGHRVMATVLRSGPDVAAQTVVRSPTAVTQRVADETELTTVLGDDAAAVTRTLDTLLTPSRRGASRAAAG